MNNKHRLPNISIAGDVQFLKKRTYDEQVRQAREQYKEDSRTSHGGSNNTYHISLEFIELAPKKYMFNLTDQARKITRIITTSISGNSQGTTSLSEAKRNPLDVEKKAFARSLIVNEFSRHEESNHEILNMDPVDKNILKGLIINELIGLSVLEPLWTSKRVTEIIANGPYDIQVEERGKIRKIESLQFIDVEHLEDFIQKIYAVLDRTISKSFPLDNARLYDNSRVHVAGKAVAPTGPNLNIRKHDAQYWSPQDIINQGTANIEMMTDLGRLINAGASYLVIGSTGSGKTTLLNALTGFYRDDVRIVTLEKNIEMKPHPNKLFASPMETVMSRSSSTVAGISMRNLVEAATQMRPDIMIIGEVIDGAAYDLCQAGNTGHSIASTVHANDAQSGVSRLQSLASQEGFIVGEPVFKLISEAFDFIIVVERFPDGSRKISEIAEMGNEPKLDENTGKLMLPTTTLWKYIADDYDEDSIGEEGYKVTGDWLKFNDLSRERSIKNQLNLAKELSWEELSNLFEVKNGGN